jgi:hypothetical protein
MHIIILVSLNLPINNKGDPKRGKLKKGREELRHCGWILSCRRSLTNSVALHMKETRGNEGISEKDIPTYKIIIINIIFLGKTINGKFINI